ncbi:MAG: hypothetical protein AAGH15_26725 [Myxococcota bacterium]
MRVSVLASVLAALLPACMLINLTESEKLRDAVNGYNEELRWSRMDLAVQRVDPSHRAAFQVQHTGWGRDIQLADVEVVGMRVADEEIESATSTVTYRWYDQRTLLIAETTVVQTWEKRRGNFFLVTEAHAEGDPGLLAELPEELLGGDAEVEEPAPESESEPEASEEEARRDASQPTG